MKRHEKIDYVEFPAKDMKRTMEFFGDAFGWTFEQFGSEYAGFHGGGLDGGFYLSDQHSSTKNGASIIIFYSENLEETEKKVVNSGGKIVTPTFPFPGGRRFHFTDPNENEFAVWSDKGI